MFLVNVIGLLTKENYSNEQSSNAQSHDIFLLVMSQQKTKSIFKNKILLKISPQVSLFC